MNALFKACLLLACCLIQGCRKEIVTINNVTVPDIYASGNNNNVPGYWKNKDFKTIEILGEASEGFSSYLICMVVSNKDVYLGGTIELMGKGPPRIWKNGKLLEAPLGLAYGRYRSIFVVGGNIYGAGERRNWDGSFATYYSNQHEIGLSQIAGSSASSIYVFEKDVYVEGQENNRAVVWKNGAPQTIFNNGESAFITSMVASRSELFLLGLACGGTWPCPTALTAFYMKGSTFVPLSTVTSANTIFLKDNDVYVAGMDCQAACIPKYWKNGIQVDNLPPGSYPLYLFVTEKDTYYAEVKAGKILLYKNGVIQQYEVDGYVNNVWLARP